MEHQTEQFYRDRADTLADEYDRAEPTYFAHVVTLSNPDARILDVGCGTGRDVARLRERGRDAIGVDRSAEMIEAGRKRYGLPELALRVDTLPDLATIRTGQFDVVICAAVLQHIEEESLLDALYRLRSLVAPGGFLVLSIPEQYPLKDTALDHSNRLFHLRPPEQYTFFLERLGLTRIVSYDEPDSLGRPERTWRVMVFSAGAGSELRPVETIESILWEDRKRNTYKFALVRALAHLAVHRSRIALWHADGRVSVAVDEVVSLWLRYYWPLVQSTEHDPVMQGYGSGGGSDIAFREKLSELADRWKPGGGFAAFRTALESGALDPNSRSLLSDASSKIRTAIQQPIRYAGNDRTGKALFSFESNRIYLPGEMWTELALMGRWIEDSVVIRWAEFSGNLKGQNPSATVPQVLSLLLDEPSDTRETNLARDAFTPLLRANALECAWTGQQLDRFDVDHAIPWALWRNNDLWNLLPVHPKANNEKRARIPSRNRVIDRKAAIVASWTVLFEAYRTLFLAHAGAFVGKALTDFGRDGQSALFDAFKDALEYTAVNRGVARW